MIFMNMGGNDIMEFSIKEYSKYNESEILNLYQRVGVGFEMDTDIECRAFTKML